MSSTSAAQLQRTLALIKPDAIQHADAIVEIAMQKGFTVLERRRVRLTPEETSDFYAEHYGKPDFSAMIAYMSRGPIVALVLAKGSNTVADWQELMGPEDVKKAQASAPGSVRARFGTAGLIPDEAGADGMLPDLPHRDGNIKLMNAVHGSETPVAAQREIRFFFPHCVVEPLPNPDAARDFINTKINPTLIKGLTALVKAKPADPLRFIAGWLEQNNPNRPQVSEPE